MVFNDNDFALFNEATLDVPNAEAMDANPQMLSERNPPNPRPRICTGKSRVYSNTPEKDRRKET